MKRRDFLAQSGAAACVVLAPIQMKAQVSRRPYRIGYLAGEQQPKTIQGSSRSLFVRGMNDLGYVTAKDFVVEWRFANWNVARLNEHATELVGLGVDVLIASTQTAVRAAQQATSSIPIVMAISVDPVESGLIRSLARPGGNTTGLSSANNETYPKQLDLLKRVNPNLSSVAILSSPGGLPNRDTPVPDLASNLVAAARALNIQIVRKLIFQSSEISPTVSGLKRDGCGGVMMASAALLNANRRLIAQALLNEKLPSISQRREFAEAGGLMSYGESSLEFHRRTAYYVDKILKGAKPSELPVELPTRFRFIVNLKTAKALSIDMPSDLLGIADDVIE